MAMVVGEASFSTSTSIPPPRSWTYQVFLSFRGEDTRRGFTDHLYASLKGKGITTFKDDKDLERGEVISIELLKAIEESMFAITVLSPNYASSTWCLDELHKIVECSKNLGLEIVPVFYGVEPSDVRYQKGNFGEAFKKHEDRFGQDSEQIKRWRDALTQIASYSGWNSKNQHEARLVECIVEHIHKKLIPKLPSCTKNHVGIASRVEKVIKLIGIRLNNVRFVGIWGMGGIGKTTIARAVYEAIQDEFKVCCFMRNVRELHEKNGLVHLQKDLLSCLNISASFFHDIEDGKKIIKSSLCNKKVLIVLDDVSEIKQLENLAENQDWFGQGSTIIITTRDKHLLNGHGVHEAYEVKGLDKEEAYHLFCLKAFKHPEPKEGYLDLSKEVVKYTKGVPLAVEVLGSYLYGRDIHFWHSTVREIKNGPYFEIHEALKISYDHLMPAEKNIFLDIACFFKGEHRDEVIRILKMCDYCVGIGSEIGSGIITLIDKSLVTLNQDNMLEMHDLLQEMGRHIVYTESPNNPGKRSRLWSKKDINLVCTQNKGTEEIQSIVLHLKWYLSDLRYGALWSDKAFLNMSQLKFLSLAYVKFPIHIKLPGSLKVLHLTGCYLETLLPEDQQYELVEIKLFRCEIVELWHGKKFLEKLMYLKLCPLSKLKQMPDLSGAPNLETLDLSNCDTLTKINPSLMRHKNLVVLDLSCCNSLETLPGKLEMSSLKELRLYGFKNLKKFPEFGECMKHLSTLSLGGMDIRELPTSLGCLAGLSDLSLRECKKLTCIPDSLHGLKSLRVLNVSYCPNIYGLVHFVLSLPSLSSLCLQKCSITEESFPCDVGLFPLLRDLDLSDNDFVRAPIRIHELPKLRRLCLNRCEKLKFLPELPSSIRELESYFCDSLNTSRFNNLSKACCVFASTSQDRGEVLQMKVLGEEIPSWFVHRQKWNRVSVSLPHNCPPNERLGLALCFLLRTDDPYAPFTELRPLVICYGEGLVTKRVSGLNSLWVSPVLCRFIVCLTSDYFSDEFGQYNFELSFKDRDRGEAKILSSAARWVCKQDIEDLVKS